MSNQPVQTVTTAGDKAKVALSLCAVLAGIVGFYFLADQPTVVRVGALLGGLIVAIGIAYTSTMGQTFIGFAREAVREVKKVVWPTRKEALQMTAIVFGFVLVMALFLWGVDKLLGFVFYNLILGWR
jgi:preprotein translocase subunit SecE